MFILEGDDWLEVDPQDPLLRTADATCGEDRSGPVSCVLERGDLLLWDSRVIHCSYPGRNLPGIEDVPSMATSENSENDSLAARGLIRACVLVCYMPHSKLSDTVRYFHTKTRQYFVRLLMVILSTLIDGWIFELPHFLSSSLIAAINRESRTEALREGRTLTHWVNKVS